MGGVNKQRPRLPTTHLPVEAELLDLVDAVDHHVHQRKQAVHVFGGGVAHARHYPRYKQRDVLNMDP